MRSIMWVEKQNKIQWYLGYVLEVNEEDHTFQIDHLERHPEGQNKFWKYPKTADKCTIEIDQLLDVEIKGKWTTDDRNRRFILENEKEICFNFKEQT